MNRKKHGFMHDEQGDRSTSRALLWLVTPNILALIWFDAAMGARFDVPQPAYVLLGTMFTFSCVWAGGRAMMRYVGPQLSGVAQAIAGSGNPASRDPGFKPHEWAAGQPDAGVI